MAEPTINNYVRCIETNLNHPNKSSCERNYPKNEVIPIAIAILTNMEKIKFYFCKCNRLLPDQFNNEYFFFKWTIKSNKKYRFFVTQKFLTTIKSEAKKLFSVSEGRDRFAFDKKANTTIRLKENITLEEMALLKASVEIRTKSVWLKIDPNLPENEQMTENLTIQEEIDPIEKHQLSEQMNEQSLARTDTETYGTKRGSIDLSSDSINSCEKKRYKIDDLEQKTNSFSIKSIMEKQIIDLTEENSDSDLTSDISSKTIDLEQEQKNTSDYSNEGTTNINLLDTHTLLDLDSMQTPYSFEDLDLASTETICPKSVYSQKENIISENAKEGTINRNSWRSVIGLASEKQTSQLNIPHKFSIVEKIDRGNCEVMVFGNEKSLFSAASLDKDNKRLG